MGCGEIGRQGWRLIRHGLDTSTFKACLEAPKSCMQIIVGRLPGELRSPGSARHPPVDSFKQVAKLGCRDRHHPVGRRRPDETSVLQPLGEQTHALPVAPEDLDEVTTLAAKDENMAAIGVAPENLLNLQRQAVHPAPHVSVPGRQPYPCARRERDHRRRRRTFITAFSVAVTAAGSAAPSIFTRTPPGSVISIRPASDLAGITDPTSIKGPAGSVGVTSIRAISVGAAASSASSRRHLKSWGPLQKAFSGRGA
jgi:hypothetical protein